MFSALECLAAHHKRTEVIEEFKDVSAEGIIENVFLIGAAATASKKRWKRCASHVCEMYFIAACNRFTVSVK